MLRVSAPPRAATERLVLLHVPGRSQSLLPTLIPRTVLLCVVLPNACDLI